MNPVADRNFRKVGPEKMRVLLIGNFLSDHNLVSRQVCEDLALRLTDAGHTILTASSLAGRTARISHMLATALVKRSAFDVAHIDIFSGPSFIWAEAVSWLLRKLGKPMVFTLHGGGLPDFAKRNSSRVRRVLSRAEVVTSPSSFLARRMVKFNDNICIVPNAIDLSRYQYRKRDRPKPKLLWMRAFDQVYNPEMAPIVLRAVCEQFPEATLSMIGPDKNGSMGRVRAAAAGIGVGDAIEFLGFVPKERVPGCLTRADIFLNTARVDNTPVSVIEAMACGLCVVSTNVGGIPHLVEHDYDALLVPPDDPDAMSAAVYRILNEPGLARRLSENGRRKAETHDWSILLPKWEILFREVANGSFG